MYPRPFATAPNNDETDKQTGFKTFSPCAIIESIPAHSETWGKKYLFFFSLKNSSWMHRVVVLVTRWNNDRRIIFRYSCRIIPSDHGPLTAIILNSITSAWVQRSYYNDQNSYNSTVASVLTFTNENPSGFKDSPPTPAASSSGGTAIFLSWLSQFAPLVYSNPTDCKLRKIYGCWKHVKNGTRKLYFPVSHCLVLQGGFSHHVVWDIAYHITKGRAVYTMCLRHISYFKNRHWWCNTVKPTKILVAENTRINVILLLNDNWWFFICVPYCSVWWPYLSRNVVFFTAVSSTAWCGM